VNRALVALVRRRAGRGCEYCRLPQAHSAIPFEIDHVLARKHGGPTAADNLALACFYCNSAKGPNVAGLDPETGTLAPLFHPRRQTWARHFRWHGPRLVGRTRTGRATIAVLALDDAAFVALREALIACRPLPPRVTAPPPVAPWRATSACTRPSSPFSRSSDGTRGKKVAARQSEDTIGLRTPSWTAREAE
jgi:hypothetical protein